jgi:CelD/BcsL family acetyltransferase involved in cellulose biosynthesis
MNVLEEFLRVHLQVARSAAEIEKLRDAWLALEWATPSTIFQSFAWNLQAARSFADREAPFVVYAENESGAVILPAAVNAQGITMLGEALFDYRDLLWSGDRGLSAAAWAEVARLGLSFAVTAVRGDAPAWGDLKRTWFSDAPYVPRELDTERFAAAHRKAARFFRRLLRKGTQLKRYSGSASQLLRWIYGRKAEQFAGGEDNLFADPRRIEFLVAVAGENPSRVEVFTLETAQQIVAALVTFLDEHVRRFYTTYFDRAWAHDSPGTALLFEVTRQSLAQGLECDYMTGSHPYKRRFATAAMPLYRVRATAAALADFAARLAPAEMAA